MGSRLTRMSALLLMCAWALGAWIAGCSKKTTAPKPPSERVNEYKPNANGRITSQVNFGDVDKKSFLGSMRRADDGSFVFEGFYNSSSGVGVLNAGGSLRWFQRVSYEPRAVAALPGTAIAPHGLVAVGAYDSTGDGLSETGYVSLYSSSGSLLSQVLVASDSSAVWLNGIVQVAESTLVGCGGERRAGVEHPLIALLHLKAPGLVEVARTATLPGIVGILGIVVTLPSSPTELVLAVTSENGPSGSIHQLRAPWPGFDAVTVEWSRELVSTAGSVRAVDDLEQAGGNLYVAGIVEDHRKQPPPSNGMSWDSGLAASYTASGDLRWVTTDSLTQRNDGISSIAIGPDALYAVGFGANYAYYPSGGSPGETFGYGLIAKLDLNSGQLIANFTLGQERSNAGFFTAVWTATGLTCGGWTEEELNGGSYRGWLVTVDVSGTVPAPTVVSRGALDPDAASRPRLGRDRELR